MNGDLLLLVFLLAPLGQALCIALAARWPAARDTACILLALAYAGLAGGQIALSLAGENAYVVLARPLPGADFAFAPEPFGLTVAGALAALGALNASFAAGYFRSARDPAPARAQILLALSLGAANAAALAGNVFTFLLCYEALALAGFGLIAHAGEAKARRAAGLSLIILLGAAMGLLLPAMVWTQALAGKLDFVAGGLLTGKIGPIEADVLLALFAFGLAGAALLPMHLWLPAAMQATPPAALAQAVGVSAIGALGMVKVSRFVFGAAMAQAAYAREALLGLALAGGVYCALVAIGKDDVKQRLAYLTVSHVALVTAGAMLASPLALFAAAFQIVAHAVAKASLYFTVGAAAAVTGRTRASQFEGLGRHMPWAFAGFALAGLSLSGVPPLAGAWSLMWLAAGAGESGRWWAVVLIVALAIASFAALAPLAGRALFAPAPARPFEKPDAASALLIAPVALAAAALAGLVFLVDPLSRFLGVRLAP